MRGFKRHASFIVTNVTYWAAMRSKSRECPLMTPATAWELLLWIIHFILIITSIIIVSLQLDSVAGKSAGSMTYIKFADLSVYRNHRLGGNVYAKCRLPGLMLSSDWVWGGTRESASLSNISVDSDTGGVRSILRNTGAKFMCALSPVHLDTMHLSISSGAQCLV